MTTKEPEEPTDEVSRYQKFKIGTIKQGILTFISSVKWVFFSIIGIAYIIVYTGAIPEDDIAMLSIMASATMAIGIIFGYIIIDTKWDKRSRQKDKNEIAELREEMQQSKVEHAQWQDSFFLNFQQTTDTLRGTIQALKDNSEKSIYLINKPTALLTETNMLFEEEFGWTHEELNEELNRVSYLDRPKKMVELLVRQTIHDKPDDVEDLIRTRIFNGNKTRGRMNNVWLCRKNKSDFSADIVIEPVDDSIVIGFIKNTENEKHRQATDEAVYNILVQFRDHIEGKQNSKSTRKAMTKHLDMMRSIRDGK